MVNNKKCILVAPVNGRCIDLKNVPDEMFSEKIMGDGVAFEYTDDVICSPCDGIIEVIANTSHAIGLTSDKGLEILIHVGVDTVNLGGKGFEPLVKKGDKVKAGTPILKIDRKFMADNNINLITPMVITNYSDFSLDFKSIDKTVVKGKTGIIEYFSEKENNIKGGVEVMKYQSLCEDILKNIGGKDNIISVTHCVTRLRFKLKDESKANTEALKKMKGVMKIIQTGGQYQVVVGTHVDEVYKEFLEISGVSGEASNEVEQVKSDEKGVLSKFLVLMSGIFQPVLGILMASGMIKALLKLVVLAGWMDSADTTYIILNSIGDALLYYFPIALGWSSAKKFGIKEIYGITLGACLTYPAITALTKGDVLYTLFSGTMFEADVFAKFFGIPVILPMQSYTGSVIPIILIVFIASKIYKFLNKNLPALVRSFFVPFFTLLITVPLGLIVIGPIAMFIQDILGQAIQAIVGFNAGIAGLILGTFWSVLVMFGLHMAIIPLFALNVSQYGYDVINPLIFSGALASMGAVLGVIIRCKSVEERNIAIPAFISTFFGVNEPTLYGVLVPRKKVMISCFLSAGIGSAITGFSGAKLYAFGASGPLGLPCFINPQGIDSGFIGLCIGAVVSFALALIASLIVGATKDVDAKKKEKGDSSVGVSL